jgi:hypothetical protein
VLIRYLRESKLEELANHVQENLPRYKSGSFDGYGLENSYWSFESKETTFNPQDLATLKLPDGKGNYFEAENSLIVYSAFRELSRFQACRPGLWTYYCHTYGLKYIIARYRKEIMSDDTNTAIKAVIQHCFSDGTNRQLTRDNGLSRLYWNGSLLSQLEDDIDVQKAANTLLSNTDIRASLIERPALITSNALNAAIRFLIHKKDLGGNHDSFFIRKKKTGDTNYFSYRDLFMFLNRLGGKYHLNLLDSQEILEMILNHEKTFRDN